MFGETADTSIESKNNIDYFFYIIILILLIYIILLIITNFCACADNVKDTFENTTANAEIINDLKSENETLLNINKKINNLLEEQERSFYLAKNFDKIDESSFNDENNFIMSSFNNIILPEINLSKYHVISTTAEMNNVIEEAKQFKNYYKPGDIVMNDSDFGITRNDICYNPQQELIKSNPDFISQHPGCMVCTVNNKDDYKNTKSWRNTHTNIEQVCLYNPSAEAESNILNLDGCKKFCNILT
jgi:hypothetical protein